MSSTSIPVSQICAFRILPSTVMERVANSTPMVDLVSWLNSLRVKRERTASNQFVVLPITFRKPYDCYKECSSVCMHVPLAVRLTIFRHQSLQ